MFGLSFIAFETFNFQPTLQNEMTSAWTSYFVSIHFFLIIHYTFKYFVFKYFFFVLIFSSPCRFSQFKFPNVNSRFFICIPLYSFLLLNILVIAIITSYFLLTYSILNFYFLTIFFLWLIHKLNNEVLMFVSV